MTIQLVLLSPTARQASRFIGPLAVLAAVALIASLGLYLILLVPAQERLTQANTTYDLLRQQQIRHQTARKALGELAKVWEQLPAQRDFTSFGVDIAQLAKTNNVRIPGMGYDLEPAKDGLAAKGAISFEASGAYGAIRHFIYQLETSDSYLFIEKLTAGRSKKPDRVAFKIQVGTYFKPDQGHSLQGAEDL